MLAGKILAERIKRIGKTAILIHEILIGLLIGSGSFQTLEKDRMTNLGWQQERVRQEDRKTGRQKSDRWKRAQVLAHDRPHRLPVQTKWKFFLSSFFLYTLNTYHHHQFGQCTLYQLIYDVILSYLFLIFPLSLLNNAYSHSPTLNIIFHPSRNQTLDRSTTRYNFSSSAFPLTTHQSPLRGS